MGFSFSTLLMSMPGGTEIIVIVLILLILFGGKKIPELMKGLGKGIRDFNQAKNTAPEDVKNSIEQNIP